MCFSAVVIVMAAIIPWKGSSARSPREVDVRQYAEQTPANALETLGSFAGKTRTVKNGPPSDDTINPDRYVSIVNKICKPLSAAEEAEYLLANARSVSSLVALASLGSPLRASYLTEAYQKNPDDYLPIIQILCSDVGRDADQSELIGRLKILLPNDSVAAQLSALERLSAGDREGCIDELRRCVKLGESADIATEISNLAQDALISCGRSVDAAKARTHLTTNSGISIFTDMLVQTLGGVDSIASNEIERACVMDMIHQQIFSNKASVTLQDSEALRATEIQILEAIASRNSENTTEYFSQPVAEMLADSKMEMNRFYDVFRIADSKPLVFEQLSPARRSQLLERISRDGEVVAYTWLLSGEK